MKIEIKSNNDEFFNCETFVKYPEDTPIIQTLNSPQLENEEKVVEESPQPPSIPTDPGQHRSTNSFNIFEGTSWGGRVQRPDTRV